MIVILSNKIGFKLSYDQLNVSGSKQLFSFVLIVCINHDAFYVIDNSKPLDFFFFRNFKS